MIVITRVSTPGSAVLPRAFGLATRILLLVNRVRVASFLEV